ncbi:MAG TPA: hypothetical protein VHA14_18030 [Bryobacteraceae bacterium]|nr:hypothetical protein [Bryobacteraceae bacterium]
MPKLTAKDRARRLLEYERNRTPEDLEIEAREEADDERYLAALDPADPCIPIEDVWQSLGPSAAPSSRRSHKRKIA